MEIVELARNTAAIEWVDKNVPPHLIPSFQAWARRIIDKVDEDDCAHLGTIIHEAKEQRVRVGSPSMRAHVYGLVFNWDDGRKSVAYRALLRVNDSGQIVEFIAVDKE
jgi:hypothetical protein